MNIMLNNTNCRYVILMIVYVLFYLIDYSKYIILIGPCQLQKYTPYSACNAFILWTIWYYIFSMENSIVRSFSMK
jgi:hypothetical protein